LEELNQLKISDNRSSEINSLKKAREDLTNLAGQGLVTFGIFCNMFRTLKKSTSNKLVIELSDKANSKSRKMFMLGRQ